MQTSKDILQNVKTLVFSGGGVRGLAFVGALQVIRDTCGIDFGARNPKVDDVSGVSIGTTFALMIACGYTVPEITLWSSELRQTDMMKADPVRILSGELSIDDGLKVRAFIQQILSKKKFDIDITFSELREKTDINLHVVVTDITAASVVHICANTHPNLSVVTAMLASMSIPLVFPPVVSSSGHLWVDGAILENFPIMRFDPSTLLGFDFYLAMEKKYDSLLTYITRIMHVMQAPSDAAAWNLTSHEHKKRVVKINTGNITTLGSTISSSEVSNDHRHQLLSAGARAMHHKLQEWDEGILREQPGGPVRTLPTYLSSLSTCHPRPEPLCSFISH